MKFGLKHYWKPTPLKMRKLGDSIAVACGSISGLAYIGQAPTWVVTSSIIAAFVGKFITNYFTEDEKEG